MDEPPAPPAAEPPPAAKPAGGGKKTTAAANTTVVQLFRAVIVFLDTNNEKGVHTSFHFVADVANSTVKSKGAATKPAREFLQPLLDKLSLPDLPQLAAIFRTITGRTITDISFYTAFFSSQGTPPLSGENYRSKTQIENVAQNYGCHFRCIRDKPSEITSRQAVRTPRCSIRGPVGGWCTDASLCALRAQAFDAFAPHLASSEMTLQQLAQKLQQYEKQKLSVLDAMATAAKTGRGGAHFTTPPVADDAAAAGADVHSRRATASADAAAAEDAAEEPAAKEAQQPVRTQHGIYTFDAPCLKAMLHELQRDAAVRYRNQNERRVAILSWLLEAKAQIEPRLSEAAPIFPLHRHELAVWKTFVAINNTPKPKVHSAVRAAKGIIEEHERTIREREELLSAAAQPERLSTIVGVVVLMLVDAAHTRLALPPVERCTLDQVLSTLPSEAVAGASGADDADSADDADGADSADGAGGADDDAGGVCGSGGGEGGSGCAGGSGGTAPAVSPPPARFTAQTAHIGRLQGTRLMAALRERVVPAFRSTGSESIDVLLIDMRMIVVCDRRSNRAAELGIC
jgi:hypothetical protein